jgi:hypothetical protein
MTSVLLILPDATAIFHLMGMVMLIAPREWEFELETGTWATNVHT